MNYKDAWTRLFTFQANANDVLAGHDWRTNREKYDYKAALIDEAVEARISAGYAPFWSGGEKPAFNLSNLKLEIVDILHFLMSVAMQDAEIEGRTQAELVELASDAFSQDILTPDGWKDHYLHSFLGDALTDSDPFLSFAFLCRAAGLSFEELYGKYLAKNALNVFRKSIGYKQDKSVKYWASGATGPIEDNVFVMALLDKAVADGEDLLSMTLEDMTAAIRTEYEIVTGKSLS